MLQLCKNHDPSIPLRTVVHVCSQVPIKFIKLYQTSSYVSEENMYFSVILKYLTANFSFQLKVFWAAIDFFFCVRKWSLTLREECRLKVYENRILRRIFGPKRDENGQWRRIYNEELPRLYPSSNIVRVIKSRRLR